MGRANLKVVLGSHSCVFDKAKIIYKLAFQNKVKQYISFHIKKQILLLLSFVCMRKYHTIRNYKYDVPYGKVKWMLKCAKIEINTTRPKLIKVQLHIISFVGALESQKKLFKVDD